MSDCDEEIDEGQLVAEDASCTDPNSWGFGSYALAFLTFVFALFAVKKALILIRSPKTKTN